MLDIRTPSKQTVLDQLADAFRTSLDPHHASLLIEFSRQFYSVSAPQELSTSSIDQLYATVLSYWKTIQAFDATEAKVEVFNPNVEQHGWHSGHTVIRVHVLDMPFLVDSVRVELNRQELAIHSISNCVIKVRRDQDGQLLELKDSAAGEEGRQAESVIHLEVDRHTGADSLRVIREALVEVLAEVRMAVDDHIEMREQLGLIQQELHQGVTQGDGEQREEINRFLDWLLDDHFIFLGYQAWQLDSDRETTPFMLRPGHCLGVMRCESSPRRQQESEGAHDAVLPALIDFAKDSHRSRVHRPGYRDVIVIKRLDADGKTIGEHRLVGLYTSTVYSHAPEHIPLIRHKIAAVLAHSGFEPGGHSFKRVSQILKDMPRDEILLASTDELQELAMGIFNLQERRKASLFIRADKGGRYYSCLYYVPRDLFNTALREKVQQILVDGLGAVDVEMSAALPDSVLFRAHFVLYVEPEAQQDPDMAAIEARVMAASRSWEGDLKSNLVEVFGEEAGNRCANLFSRAFSSAYKEHFSSANGVCDIQHMEQLAPGRDIALRFYQSIDPMAQGLKFKLYTQDAHLVLSDVIPLLENLGMRVLAEHPYVVRRRDDRQYWISDFKVSCKTPNTEAERQVVYGLIQDAFSKIWAGGAENDSFNHLILGAGLGWREVALLRAYARYSKQLRFGFSQPFLADTLGRNLAVTRLLVALFQARFEPADTADEHREEAAQHIEQQIQGELDRVDSLDDDRILRRFLILIRATIRTNYYQRTADGEPKEYFSFKLDPQIIPDIPQPRPMFEVFVYSPQMEGVHLRSGKVARGGIRWSDRMEDYRTEVLGLVKAQQVKNSVIVPVGAKGCFIVKQPPSSGGREAILAAGQACYRTYIRGLLDLADNLVGGQIRPPAEVVRHDGDDPYLVVAADKGTATFSDIANDISDEYGFWLGDAFASGGSQGYDHKKMGITARGAWESVKRHFRERGLDTQTERFSVIGIGDMAGDVFGNGMLLSESIALMAAFNHLHIFVDPTPDVGRAFTERQRLFGLPRSSWSDYDTSLISEGGGVFSRSAKWIEISPKMQSAFAIEADRLTPNELITALLKTPVDMIWNGGIGTYIKATVESHEMVGDKANDGLRVDGQDVQCRALGEGGNLGVTQRGRIEFALKGGAVNTDFIDNAGGVDCSDHEVNIKILLNELVQQGDMTLKQRNQLLREMTDDVARLVLKNNYRQAQALNIADAFASESVDEHMRLMRSLESAGRLDRTLEFLPSDKELLLRKEQGQGLTRPELSVLISYAKIELKQALVDSWLTEDPWFSQELNTAFPRQLQDKFPDALRSHRLRREITATQIANDLVNRMGITFVHSVRTATGADFAQIAAAYLIVRDVFGIAEHWDAIEALDGQVPVATQIDMMRDLIRLVRRGSYWVLRYRRYELDLPACIEAYREALTDAVSSVEQLGLIVPQDRWQEKFGRYCEQAVPELLAAYCASAESQYWLLDIIETARHRAVGIVEVASVYFTLGEKLNLVWLDRQILAFPAGNHWQSLAVSSYRNELDHQLRALTQGVIDMGKDDQEAPAVSDLLARWFQRQDPLLKRWHQTLAEVQRTKVTDCAVFSVALSVLLELA